MDQCSRAKLTRLFTAMALVVFGSHSWQAWAAPSGSEVVAGEVSINHTSAHTKISQASQNAIINWQSFDIGQSELVSFNQPNAASVALNRIVGNNPTAILGTLTANGQVFLVNPNGIAFAPGAQVSVGGFVASTLDIANEDFLQGDYNFSAIRGNGAIHNQGSIAANTVALLGNSVINQGWIVAKASNDQRPNVALVAADAVTISFGADELLAVDIEQGTLQGLVENHQLIQANGGQILLRAEAADQVLGAAINNTGTLRAQSLAEVDGQIVLVADMAVGTAEVDGAFDVSAPIQGDGGFIETSAASVHVKDSAKVNATSASGDTGTWLIDPNDFTIAPIGGNITGTTLSGQLALANVTIATALQGTAGGNGDIFVNDAVTWSAPNTVLTLQAERNVHINNTITASGNGAGLVLDTGLSNTATAAEFAASQQVVYRHDASVNLTGVDAVYTVDGQAYQVVNGSNSSISGATALDELQNIDDNLAGHYALGVDVDATTTSTWNAGAGFAPIGTLANNFAGGFDGLGNSISNIFINRPTTTSVGLFGDASTAATYLRNVGLIGGSITAGGIAGGLVGDIRMGYVNNAHASVSMFGAAGSTGTGGLIGHTGAATITNSHATGDVTGAAGAIELGGLAGVALAGSNLTNVYATGNITALASSTAIGGLVGFGPFSTITNGYATGDVLVGASTAYTGGLVGYADTIVLTNAYATGSVSGGDSANVIGGLVGYAPNSIITDAYSIGAVAGGVGASIVGGLIGFGGGAALDGGYWDNQASGQANAVGGGALASGAAIALTTAQTQQRASFAAFDISDPNVQGQLNTTWRIFEGSTTPFLTSQLLTAEVGLSDTNQDYDGGVSFDVNGLLTYDPIIDQGQISGTPLAITSSKNAGNYTGATLSLSGLISTRYSVVFSPAAIFTIDPRTLAVSATSQNKVYDALTTAVSTFSDNRVPGDTLVITGTNNFSDKNVGAGKVVTSNLVLSGLDAVNYQLASNSVNSSADITAATLTVAATTANRVYDGTTAAQSTFTDNRLGTDVLTVAGVSSFADKNVGNAKVVSNSGLVISGVDAGNYLLASNSVNSAADITAASLTVTATTGSKVYDGNTTATSTFADDRIAGDVLTINAASDFSDKNVGAGKAVSNALTLAGVDANNYVLSSALVASSADITQATLNVTAIASDRVYDGTTMAAVVFTDDRIAGDLLAITANSVFVDENVGIGKAVTSTNVAISGADALNYQLGATTFNSNADIDPFSLAVTAVADDKAFDGTTDAVVALMDNRIVGDDLSIIEVSNFASPAVGMSIPVMSVLSLSGTDAANYVLGVSTIDSVADITSDTIVLLPAIPADNSAKLEATRNQQPGDFSEEQSAQLAPQQFLVGADDVRSQSDGAVVIVGNGVKTEATLTESYIRCRAAQDPTEDPRSIRCR